METKNGRYVFNCIIHPKNFGSKIGKVMEVCWPGFMNKRKFGKRREMSLLPVIVKMQLKRFSRGTSRL